VSSIDSIDTSTIIAHCHCSHEQLKYKLGLNIGVGCIKVKIICISDLTRRSCRSRNGQADFFRKAEKI